MGIRFLIRLVFNSLLGLLISLSPAHAGGNIGIMFFPVTLTSSVGGIVATGGTITTSGGYTVHTFTSSGTFQVTNAPGGATAEVLIVAGGGGGGRERGGGGGAGGLLYYGSETPKTPNGSAVSVSANSYSIVVGVGGQAAGPTANSSPTAGGSSSAFGYTAIGGGYGGGRNVPSVDAAGGGSGGGGPGNEGGTNAVPSPGGAGTSNQGYAGGQGAGQDGTNYSCGGGGGSGSAGVARSGANGGDGGSGLTYSISGSAVTYAGGGGGCSYTSTPGNGGAGGGGKGGVNGNEATSGTANTGGGGGGGSNNGNSGAGGSGVVIIRYPTILPLAWRWQDSIGNGRPRWADGSGVTNGTTFPTSVFSKSGSDWGFIVDFGVTYASWTSVTFYLDNLSGTTSSWEGGASDVTTCTRQASGTLTPSGGVLVITPSDITTSTEGSNCSTPPTAGALRYIGFGNGDGGSTIQVRVRGVKLIQNGNTTIWGDSW